MCIIKVAFGEKAKVLANVLPIFDLPLNGLQIGLLLQILSSLAVSTHFNGKISAKQELISEN